MRELKILIVLIVFTLLTYWGVEPYAHSVMHPHVEPASFDFADVASIDLSKGDVAKGAELFAANCAACHGLESAGMKQAMSNADLSASYGVVPPDLSNAGAIYDTKFLAGFIKNPVKAFHIDHAFDAGDGAGKPFPMPNYEHMSDEEIASLVAYLKSVAPASLTDKQVFEAACSRCHDMKYDKITKLTDNNAIKGYMGTLPPDLSMMIRSRGEEYLHTFINDPQKLLPGTSMPRVGLTQKAQEQVVAYMEAVGDSKKEEREKLGPWVLGYLALFSIVAYLWKTKIWRDLH